MWVDWVEAGVVWGWVVHTERDSFRGRSGEDFDNDDETYSYLAYQRIGICVPLFGAFDSLSSYSGLELQRGYRLVKAVKPKFSKY